MGYNTMLLFQKIEREGVNFHSALVKRIFYAYRGINPERREFFPLIPARSGLWNTMPVGFQSERIAVCSSLMENLFAVCVCGLSAPI
jgi:hypothetical protein